MGGTESGLSPDSGPGLFLTFLSDFRASARSAATSGHVGGRDFRRGIGRAGQGGGRETAGGGAPGAGAGVAARESLPLPLLCSPIPFSLSSQPLPGPSPRPGRRAGLQLRGAGRPALQTRLPPPACAGRATPSQSSGTRGPEQVRGDPLGPGPAGSPPFRSSGFRVPCLSFPLRDGSGSISGRCRAPVQPDPQRRRGWGILALVLGPREPTQPSPPQVAPDGSAPAGR